MLAQFFNILRSWTFSKKSDGHAATVSVDSELRAHPSMRRLGSGRKIFPVFNGKRDHPVVPIGWILIEDNFHFLLDSAFALLN
jgi:hypothetical protein